MSEEEKLGYIGSLQARWAALVTQEEIMEALDHEVEAAVEREDELAEQESLLNDDDDLDEDDLK